MATREQLSAALVKADAAGDTADAKVFADALRAMRTSAPLASDASSPPPGAAPGSREYADWAAARARGGNALPQISKVINSNATMVDIPRQRRLSDLVTGNNSPTQSVQADRSLAGQISAGASAGVNAVPIAGPALLSGLERLRGMVQGMTPEQVQSETMANETANPSAATTGAIAGTILPFMAGGEIPMAAKILGMDASVPFLTRSLLSGGSQAAISYGDSLARGGDQTQAGEAAGLGGGLGLVMPGAGVVLSKVGAALPKAANWLTGGAFDTLRNARSPEQAAERVVGRGMNADIQNGTVMDAATEQAAVNAGSPIVNLDRGGSVTRDIARTASNTSPDARALLEGAVDRGPASNRATDFLTRLVGGNADDLALREGLRNTAKLVNAPAYKAAYSSPAAQSIWTQDLADMFQSPEFSRAVREAEGIGRTKAAIAGGRAPVQPFIFHPDGTVTMKQGVTPSLEFWDKVQQGLSRQAEALGPKERAAMSDITGLRKKLLGTLDNAVPQFQTARQGASKFFGAEDAMDAGRNFANARGQVPEAKAAYSKFSDPEKKAFGIGWASSLIDKLGTKDSYAIIKQTFENPNAREMAKLALGPVKSAQLEAYLKIEQIMQFSQDALKGNSSTARQLAMMGAVGAGTGGYGAVTGDWKPLTIATVMTAGRAGAQYLGKSVDQRVMTEVAKLLASGNKADLSRVTTNAAMSPKWKAAIDAVFSGIGASTRGVVDSALRPQPLQITVNGGGQ